MKDCIVVILIAFLLSSCTDKDRIYPLFETCMVYALSGSVNTNSSENLLINRENVIGTFNQDCMEKISKVLLDDSFGKKVLMYDVVSIPFINFEDRVETNWDQRGKTVIIFLMSFIYITILLFFWNNELQRKKDLEWKKDW